MNFPALLHQVKADSIFKISDRIKGFNIQYLPQRKIIVKQFECKKTSRSAFQNKKMQQFQLTTIQDEEFIFFQLKETGSSKPSVYTIAQEGFFNGSFTNAIFGERIQKSRCEYQVSGFKWNGIILEFIAFSEDSFLLILANEMILPVYKSLAVKDLQFKLKQGFEQIFSKIISKQKSPIVIDNITEELRKTIDKHKQIVKQTSQGKEINYNLIKYGKISEINSQEIRSRKDLDKSQNSPVKMNIQK